MQKIKTKIIDYLFLGVLFLFPILPQYIYVIGGINIVNFLVALFVVLFIIFEKIKLINMPLPAYFFWMYVGIQAIMYFLDAGILKFGTYTLSFIILPYIIITQINTKQRFLKVIDVLILGGLLLGILGLIESIIRQNFIQTFANGGTIQFFHEIRYGLLRIMTTFGQPITYGIYQCFITGLIFYRLNTSISSKKRIFLIFVYLISVLNIFLSVSRLPILMFLIMQLVALFRKSKRKFLLFVFFMGIALILAVFVCILFNINVPIVSDFADTIKYLLGDTNIEQTHLVGVGNRIDLWTWVVEALENAWIFGKGAAAEFAYRVNSWQVKTSIENQYLNVLFHTGLIGLITLILSYVAILFLSKKNDKKFGRALGEKEISFNAVMFIMLLIYFFIELGVQETDLTRMYVVLIALLIAYNKILIDQGNSYQQKVSDYLKTEERNFVQRTV